MSALRRYLGAGGAALVLARVAAVPQRGMTGGRSRPIANDGRALALARSLLAPVTLPPGARRVRLFVGGLSPVGSQLGEVQRVEVTTRYVVSRLAPPDLQAL